MAETTHALSGVCSPSIVDERAIADALVASGALSEQSLPRVIALIERFNAFCARAFAVGSLAEVSATAAEAFVRSPSEHGEPSIATMHLRRSVVRLLFRTARELGLADHDPTIDLALPPRSSTRARALSDEEVALCRAASMHSLTATRLPAAWGLAEASARSSELGHIRSGDLDLDGGIVWLHGSPRVEPRWAPLTNWGRVQLERRLTAIPNNPDRPLIYNGGRGSDYHRQAASCIVVSDVLRRAGLAGELDVRPVSVAAWAGRQVLDETGRIDEVARQLGVRSLDRAAALIGWDWTTRGLDDG